MIDEVAELSALESPGETASMKNSARSGHSKERSNVKSNKNPVADDAVR